MKASIIFVQGAGAGAHEEDQQLVDRLRAELGGARDVAFPRMPTADDAPVAEWLDLIRRARDASDGDVVVVAHSFGASAVLKLLAEDDHTGWCTALVLLAAPFWGDGGWEHEAFTLPEGWGDRIRADLPLALFHNRDDEWVPFEHLEHNARALPHATVHAADTGGHQFDDGLSCVVACIRGMEAP